jgi:endonuclease/exonuclease/phosphatase family metal-dependent hydrolase
VAVRIAALDADVVAVQEVDRRQRRSGGADQITELADRLGWQGVFAATMLGQAGAMRPAPNDGETVDDDGPAYGIGLLSRHPLTAATADLLPPSATTAAGSGADTEPRAVLRAAVLTVAGEVGITATHLSWLPWKAWRQAQQVIQLAAARPGTAVIAGDLNLPHRVVQAALRHTGWRAARAGATYPGHRPVVQLDHVLVRGGRLIETTTDPAYPSDHRIVSAAVVVPDL